MEKTFKPSSGRMMGTYLDQELITLAKVNFLGLVEQRHIPEGLNYDMLVSLERFKLLDYGNVYKQMTVWDGWGWAVSESGRELLNSMRPRHYGCKCEHAIRTACVCSESTYCPNPEHGGNGCHGTHD